MVTTAAWMLPGVRAGMIEASATRRCSRPCETELKISFGHHERRKNEFRLGPHPDFFASASDAR
jgi:hypothetical protein